MLILAVLCVWRCDPTRFMVSSFFRFLDHTQRRTTVGRTPLDEWSAHRRDLYLTIHNTHNRQISLPSVGFEPTISAGQRPQTYALDRAATGTGWYWRLKCVKIKKNWKISLIRCGNYKRLRLLWEFREPIYDFSPRGTEFYARTV
jgi:hypothetical protein